MNKCGLVKSQLCGSGCGGPYSWMTVAAKTSALKKSLHLGKWNPTFLVHWTSPLNAGSICWIWGCSGPHPENKLTARSGSKTAIPERLRFGAKRGPPRYTVVKGAEILALSQMNNTFSSGGTAELASRPQCNIGKCFKSRCNEIYRCSQRSWALISVKPPHLHISARGAKLPKGLSHYNAIFLQNFF